MKDYTKYKMSSEDKKNIYKEAINIIQHDNEKFMCISIIDAIVHKYKICYNEAENIMQIKLKNFNRNNYKKFNKITYGGKIA